jgi:hypothetical protein
MMTLASRDIYRFEMRRLAIGDGSTIDGLRSVIDRLSPPLAFVNF